MAEWFKASVLKTDVGATLPRVRIPPLPKKFSPFMGLNFLEGGVTPTAWCHVGIRSPQRCMSFAAGKGEYREGGPGQNFRQEIYAEQNPLTFVSQNASPHRHIRIKIKIP